MTILEEIAKKMMKISRNLNDLKELTQNTILEQALNDISNKAFEVADIAEDEAIRRKDLKELETVETFIKRNIDYLLSCIDDMQALGKLEKDKPLPIVDIIHNAIDHRGEIKAGPTKTIRVSRYVLALIKSDLRNFEERKPCYLRHFITKRKEG